MLEQVDRGGNELLSATCYPSVHLAQFCEPERSSDSTMPQHVPCPCVNIVEQNSKQISFSRILKLMALLSPLKSNDKSVLVVKNTP